MTCIEYVHDEVRIEYVEDRTVARLVMEPGESPLNTFDPRKVESMAAAIRDLDPVGCLVLYGESGFSAGADLGAIKGTPQEMRPATIDTIAAASNRFIRAVRDFPAPVIAAVSRVAAGGGLGFVLASDLVLMHEDAILNTGYARVGLTPDNATPFFLVNTVGPYKARELLFEPESITATEAVDLGLANDEYVVPESEFLNAVTDRAATLAAGPTEVYAKTKVLVDTTFEGSLDQHLEQERAAIKEISGSDTFDEGLSAFLEKRSPEWDEL
ncbi:enoyl-CoA hydratase/isomerase family protein [Halalkalicoccus subterraneus]|uniref:enoyl-CoA hydratase/isomerase family protein n=1 Tax=Halalkalicoccus subterraneus TaxID=2675002 RepID=UPI000EFB0E3A|nr:enoyl-CoA hydratase-related protein [Halalkalicoccus subterraneus]